MMKQHKNNIMVLGIMRISSKKNQLRNVHLSTDTHHGTPQNPLN
jgi:hypothetical protein